MTKEQTITTTTILLMIFIVAKNHLFNYITTATTVVVGRFIYFLLTVYCFATAVLLYSFNKGIFVLCISVFEVIVKKMQLMRFVSERVT